jgi:hypothetical protein
MGETQRERLPRLLDRFAAGRVPSRARRDEEDTGPPREGGVRAQRVRRVLRQVLLLSRHRRAEPDDRLTALPEEGITP